MELLARDPEDCDLDRTGRKPEPGVSLIVVGGFVCAGPEMAGVP